MAESPTESGADTGAKFVMSLFGVSPRCARVRRGCGVADSLASLAALAESGAFAALDPNNGFAAIAGSGTVNGTFSIPNVPATGTLYVKYARNYFVVDGQWRHSTDAGFDDSTVKVWGRHWYLARSSGVGIPWFDHFNQDRLGRYDLGPPDWKADRWISPEGIESVQTVADWVTKYKIQPKSTLNMNLSDADKFFASGQVIAYDFGTNTYPTARKNMQFDPLDAVFARHVAPLVSSTSSTSVKVPPTSTPSR